MAPSSFRGDVDEKNRKQKERENLLAVAEGVEALREGIRLGDNTDSLFHKVIQRISEEINKKRRDKIGKKEKKEKEVTPKDRRMLGIFRYQLKSQPEFACWQLRPKWIGYQMITKMTGHLDIMKELKLTTKRVNESKESFFSITVIPGRDLRDGQFPSTVGMDTIKQMDEKKLQQYRTEISGKYNTIKVNYLLGEFFSSSLHVDMRVLRSKKIIEETKTYVEIVSYTGGGAPEVSKKVQKREKKVIRIENKFDTLGKFILGILYLQEEKGPVPCTHFLTWTRKSLGTYGEFAKESGVLVMPVEKNRLKEELEKVETLFTSAVKWKKTLDNKKKVTNLEELRKIIARFHVRMALLRPFVYGNDRMAKLIERALYMYHTNEFPEYSDAAQKLYNRVLIQSDPSVFEEAYIEGTYFKGSLENSGKRKSRPQMSNALREKRRETRARSGTFSVSQRRNGKNP